MCVTLVDQLNYLLWVERTGLPPASQYLALGMQLHVPPVLQSPFSFHLESRIFLEYEVPVTIGREKTELMENVYEPVLH